MKNCLRYNGLQNELLMLQTKLKILLSPTKKSVTDKIQKTCHNVKKTYEISS